MVTVFLLVETIAAAGFLFLAGTAGLSGSGRRGEELFIALCISLSTFLLAAGMAVAATTVAQARLWFRVSAFGFAPFYALNLHTYFHLTRPHGEPNGHRFAQPVLLVSYGSALVILVASILEDTLFHISESPAGGIRFAPALDSGWFYFYLLYYWGCIGGSVFLLVRWGTRSRSLREKSESRILLWVTVLTLVFGSIADFLLPAFAWYSLPPIGPIALGIYLFGLWIVVFRYRFPGNERVLPAESLIAQLTDGAMLLDQDFRILSAGSTFERVFGSPWVRLLNTDLHELLTVREHGQSPLMVSGTVRRGENRGEYVSFALTKINDEFGDCAGYYALLSEHNGLAVLMSRYNLTGREVQIVQLCTEGRSNAEMSAELGIARRTVETHLANTYTKVGVRNRIELFRFLENLHIPH
jgi:DNA-binding CsgD family transcriptional regulator